MKLYLTMLLSLVLFVFAWPVRAEMDGSTWLKQSEDFKRGYAGGKLEMFMTWGDQLKETGSVGEEAQRRLQILGEVARGNTVCVKIGH